MDTALRSTDLPPGVGAIRQAVGPIAERRGIRLVVLFGSVARGEGRPRDVDLAIRGEAPLPLIKLTNEFIQALDFQHVDLADLRIADPVLQVLVARDGIPIYEASGGEFADFCSLAARRFADTAKFRDLEHAQIRDFIRRHASGS